MVTHVHLAHAMTRSRFHWLMRARFLAFILLLPQVGQAQDWECIQVEANGNLTMGWQPDGIGAVSYNLDHLLPPPDFTSFTQVSIDLTAEPTGTVLGSASGFDFSSQSFCFTLQAQDAFGSNMAGLSDTLCTLHLELSAGLIPGTVDLDWNSPFHFNPPPGFSGVYAVEQLLPDGTWLEVVSAPWLIGNSNTSIPVTQCDGWVTYRITLTETGGCVHRSNQASIEVSDELDPPPPQILAIDVDSLTGEAQISWAPSLAPDVAGYIVYGCIGAIETVLTVLEDPGQLNWTNPDSEAGNTIEYYNVAAFDSCYVGGLPDPGAANPACAPSMYLAVDWTQCTDQAELQWSPVLHWPTGVDRYEIWASELTQGGVESGPLLLGEVDGTLNYFLHLGANIGSLYRYRIVAYAQGTGWTQSSNTAENLFTYPGGPEWMRWLEASIVTDSVAVVRAEVDASSNEPHAYELWRNEPFDDDFEFVSSIFSTGGIVQMLDSSIEGQVGQYKYYLKVVNACGDSVLGTSVAETIFLNGTVLEDRLSNALSWTAFEGWDAQRTRQVLLRGIQFGGTLEEVEDFGPFDFSYDDELEDLIGTPGEFCYRVRAEQGDSGWVSVSNEVCLTLPPVVWIPNALVYNGFNNTWRPSIAFADVTDYRLDVFSRWGDLIWTTDDPQAAWDGTVDGAMLPEAFYPYTLRIQDGAGRVVTRMGHVMVVLRP